ncbi:MAG TPA: MBL fold metallo-hydrolase [Gaiellaceae bacterium]|nr:MBL fold metallo-hydrolase [Gaiellaceae bacterium]
MGQYRNVKLTVVGCSPAWPNPGGAQSGYLVETDGRRLLLDCGPGVLPRLREREDWPQVDAIAITHFHLDHWGDLVPWVWGLQFGPAAGTEPPELWVPPGGRETLARLGVELGQADMFESAFALHEYADGEPFVSAGHEVVPHRVLHYTMLAFGFRVSANGTVLGYSGDSGPDGGLREIARGADLFLCEATLLRPMPEGGTRGHLAADEAREAAEGAGAKRLLLTHRPSERPLEARYEQVYDGFELELESASSRA